MILDENLLKKHLRNPIFTLVSETADSINRPCYVIGGYVRDIFLKRNSKDIDIVTVGSGIELASAIAERLGKKAYLSVFKNFGTAQIKYKNTEVEFVGARKESYTHDSRKPVVENGSLCDDQNRRDFTINALAICLNKDKFGELIDPFQGIEDLQNKIIRTPLDPDITFSDDPLRMMRAIRFATQLQFSIEEKTFDAISRNKERIKIISKERIIDELNKIMLSVKPSTGFLLLEKTGLLALIFPELHALKGVESVEGRGHKDNFYHTLTVIDNVASKSDNLWLRWAALFHDIAKPVTKRYDEKLGWTFYNHNFIGMKMLPGIFRRLKLPLNDKLKYVQKIVELHMRPIVLAEEEVTDSAVRRLLFDAGDNIDDLMLLCEADITSKNPEKVKRFLTNFAQVRKKLKEIEEKDRIRNMQPPISGEEIMQIFALPPCRKVGEIKSAIKDAILDGIIPNEREAALRYMIKTAESMGLTLKNNRNL
ncbi:CCA tRNA nucleotidyltransferase [Coprobacter tertius]|uniref:CCA tRNA nucleotidyltransferase n=1 Tax=Coprobacter tertius TaxID=2944915 RepID=A0ABT1MIF9_9BACT|nr:HD domain-containing protein [Coprobacter tertius]MCP9611483.1 CCA tRNA nucleotidyltransferase [Coprobacter tertius]